MCYDHHKKSGNEGDVVKHVALLAVLDTLLACHNQDEFRYADTFAGYAHNPLTPGNEWQNGIGRLFQKGDHLSENVHTNLWFSWYLSNRPDLNRGTYPGSSLIASDVCRKHSKQPRLALWDISTEVIADLQNSYGEGDYQLHCESASTEASDVKNAELIFIDPPGLRSRQNRS
jgi:23S rRNA A2030 N6-methylase RlmJ